MALPDYTGGGSQNRRAVRRDRRQDKRRRKRLRGQTPYDYGQMDEPAIPADYSQITNQGTGFQGVYQPPSNTSGHPFYDPNSNYAQPGKQYNQFPRGSELANEFAQNNQAGYYYDYMNRMGLGGLDARSQAAQGMYQDYALGYKAAQNQNVELQWADYLGMQDVNGLLDRMSNQQVGIDDTAFGARNRWSMRG